MVILAIHAFTTLTEEYPDSWFRILAARPDADSSNLEEPSLMGGRFLVGKINGNVIMNLGRFQRHLTFK